MLIAGRAESAIVPGMDELDTLSMHWRSSLDAAEDALNEVSRSRRSLQFAPKT